MVGVSTRQRWSRPRPRGLRRCRTARWHGHGRQDTALWPCSRKEGRRGARRRGGLRGGCRGAAPVLSLASSLFSDPQQGDADAAGVRVNEQASDVEVRSASQLRQRRACGLAGHGRG